MFTDHRTTGWEKAKLDGDNVALVRVPDSNLAAQPSPMFATGDIAVSALSSRARVHADSTFLWMLGVELRFSALFLCGVAAPFVRLIGCFFFFQSSARERPNYRSVQPASVNVSSRS